MFKFKIRTASLILLILGDMWEIEKQTWVSLSCTRSLLVRFDFRLSCLRVASERLAS